MQDGPQFDEDFKSIEYPLIACQTFITARRTLAPAWVIRPSEGPPEPKREGDNQSWSSVWCSCISDTEDALVVLKHQHLKEYFVLHLRQSRLIVPERHIVSDWNHSEWDAAPPAELLITDTALFV